MSKDYLDKWEERSKLNTKIIEQQQTKTKKMNDINWLLIMAHIGFVLWFYVGYKLGKFQERKEWNKLIESGVLPKPKQRR